MTVCARPGCGKPLRTEPPATMPKALRHDFLAELLADPYCSTVCCRVDHGCALPSILGRNGRRGEHMAATEEATA